MEDCKCHCHNEPMPSGIQCKCIKNCVHCRPENFKERLYVNWVEADKDWMFNTYRQVFRRKSDGAEVDKEFAYKHINLDADSVGDELDKLFEKGIV